LRDNYGNEMNREHVCFDSAASVIVRTTDACPCNYADNFYSNKRWCCGDMTHFDVSIWAFEKVPRYLNPRISNIPSTPNASPSALLSWPTSSGA